MSGGPLRHWPVDSLELRPHSPEILYSKRGAVRSIALALPAGEMLQEHQVHEHAHVVVLAGEAEVSQDGDSVRGGPGLLTVFEPGQRHEVRAIEDTRLLIVLAPWPGEGHPGARDE